MAIPFVVFIIGNTALYEVLGSFVLIVLFFPAIDRWLQHRLLQPQCKAHPKLGSAGLVMFCNSMMMISLIVAVIADCVRVWVVLWGGLIIAVVLALVSIIFSLCSFVNSKVNKLALRRMTIVLIVIIALTLLVAFVINGFAAHRNYLKIRLFSCGNGAVGEGKVTGNE